MDVYKIDLLGRPKSWRPDLTLIYLNKRDALIIARLALEGETTRERMADLLWPDTPPCKQANCMRQALHQLRERVGEGVLLECDEHLELSQQCVVDAIHVKAAGRKKDWAAVIAAPPRLLGQLTYDNEPELDEWLERERWSFVRMHARALGQETRRLEQEGRWEEALELAERRLPLDPFSDEACRSIMWLHFRLGDRIAALQVYERFCASLKRELKGVEPEPETVALEIALSRRTQAPRPPPRVPQEPGIDVVHPPLVGQEKAWAALEDAWQRKVPIIYVCGEPGQGKTRLMIEFAKSKGATVRCASLPGDASNPYAAKIRTIRQLIKECPGVKLDGWVLRELGRLVPELLEGDKPLGLPERGDPAFLEANFKLYQQVLPRLGAAVYDDAQFVDRETFSVGLALEERCLPLVAAGRFPPILVGLQPGALDASEEELIRQRVSRGLAAWIDVEPLGADAVRQMLSGMRVPGLDRLTDIILEYSGGTPFVIIEVVREMLGSGRLDGGIFLPRGVRAWVERKLSRLSPGTLDVAQVLVLAKDHFNMDLLAAVLGRPFECLESSYKELVRHHLVRHRWFTQGLLPAAILEGMPEPVRATLAERIEEWKKMRLRGGLW